MFAAGDEDGNDDEDDDEETDEDEDEGNEDDTGSGGGRPCRIMATTWRLTRRYCARIGAVSAWHRKWAAGSAHGSGPFHMEYTRLDANNQ